MSQNKARIRKIPQLSDLNLQERGEYALRLLQEQVIEQRADLHFWRSLTGQSAQIDTGYIAQHLVSIVTGIRGGGFRGKGDDLEDGSEVKSANFLDSLDKQGATAPRWNFTCNDEEQMTGLLNYPAIYLVSMDFNPEDDMRFRVWKLLPKRHILFPTMLSIPEPLLLREFELLSAAIGPGSVEKGLMNNGPCTPGASCSPGQPWCRAQHTCNQWRDAYWDWSCIAGYFSSCQIILEFIPVSKIIKVLKLGKWITQTVSVLKQVERQVCKPVAIFGCARPRQCVGGWRTEYKQQC